MLFEEQIILNKHITVCVTKKPVQQKNNEVLPLHPSTTHVNAGISVP
jgi:hypothetical protein